MDNREPTGYVPNPEGVREFLAELDQPLFRGAAPEVVAKAQGKDTFLFRSAVKAHQPSTVCRGGLAARASVTACRGAGLTACGSPSRWTGRRAGWRSRRRFR